MNSMVHQALRPLQTLLVCPICKGELAYFPTLIACTACQATFPQTVQGLFNVIPGHLLQQDGNGWQTRQLEMEVWYKELLASPSEAASCFDCDYAPYAPILSELSGSILDLGGGNGIVRHFLSEGTEYIVLDPSLNWLGSAWSAIADRFSCLEERFNFVRGVGEYLPFPAGSFDHVLSFWSLNHVLQPERGFQEVHAVLRPTGRFLIVLEDMEPHWSEMNHLLSHFSEWSRKTDLIVSKVCSTLGARHWPLQKDHIRIREADIAAWSSGRFAITTRQWIGQFLTYELCRL